MSESVTARPVRQMESTAAKLPVHIRQNCEVDYEVVNVRKDAQDEIEWCSDSEDFVIEFESSPFKSNRFVVSSGQCVSSGPVRSDAAYARYHYTIRSAANLAMSADPDVDVRH